MDGLYARHARAWPAHPWWATAGKSVLPYLWRSLMDCRVKPGNDSGRDYARVW